MSIFTNHDHAVRWATAIDDTAAIDSNGIINPCYGASLYILTAMPDLYDRISKHVHKNWIDFEPMINEENLSTGETILVSLAGNLYNGSLVTAFTPFDIVSKCDDRMIKVASEAIQIRSQQLDVETVFN